MSEEKTKNQAGGQSSSIVKGIFNALLIPFKLPAYYAGCFTTFVLVLIVIVGALLFGFANNLMGGLNFLNQLLGSPAPIYIPSTIVIPNVERVQTLAQLTTTRYSYAELSGGQRDMPAWLSALYGDSVVMVTVGIIEAGIDVSQIEAEDIVFDEANNRLSLRLPTPTLLNCFLDENQSYVVQRNTAAFGTPLNQLEDVVRQNALIDYRNRAVEEGILSTAQTQAGEIMADFIGAMVGENVSLLIQFDAPLPDAPLPATCQG